VTKSTWQQLDAAGDGDICTYTYVDFNEEGDEGGSNWMDANIRLANSNSNSDGNGQQTDIVSVIWHSITRSCCIL